MEVLLSGFHFWLVVLRGKLPLLRPFSTIRSSQGLETGRSDIRSECVHIYVRTYMHACMNASRYTYIHT